jgi:TolA-binding protein
MGLAIDTEWAPMVLFWKGVAMEGKNNPRGALEFYLAITTQHSKSERAAAALLRQGSVLIRIGDKKTARLVFNKLVADFPKSAEAARARDRLKDLGK